MWRPKYANQMKTLIVSENNSYQCMDYCGYDGGTKFACAGKLPQIEIYDDDKLSLLATLKNNGSVGHSNRIFSVKFDPSSAHILYSGGWDSMICAWDLRSSKCIGSI